MQDITSAGYEYDFTWLYDWENGYSVLAHSERIQHRQWRSWRGGRCARRPPGRL